ncbi:MAG: SusD/RagB family nutrient-binding outer membrane lipoprotein [Bacteroidales bacterium]|nr:SusD/RagB family nutrient-binding outer membrane lipoprotein [Bacteroidales bacterium]
MHYLQRKVFFIALFCITVMSSCDWKTDTDEEPLEVLSALLYSTQSNLISLTYAEPTLFGSIFSQQISGVDGTMLDVENYSLQPTHFDRSWQACYLGVFSNLQSISAIAKEHGYGKYSGIAKVLTAQSLGLATCLWGDIPYSESFDSDELVLEPAYDNQKDIFVQVFQLLNQGIAELGEYGEQYHPVDEDIFFKGNSGYWIRYAHFLRVRFLLHLSKVNGFDELADEFNNEIFMEPGDAFIIDYEELQRPNPRGQYLSAHKSNLRASNVLLKILEEYDDPRLPKYFKQAGDSYTGNIPGEDNPNASTLADSQFSITSHITLASYTEWMFIKSEYLLRKGDVNAAEEAFANAVKSSLIDYDVYTKEWLETYIASVEFSLETLLVAKYTAMFLTPEAWPDWRRTGYPAIQPVASSAVPRRFLYPQTEYLYNSSNVPQNISTTTRMWIDPESKFNH